MEDFTFSEVAEQQDIIFVNPRQVTLINDSDPRHYPFYEFLLSGAKTKAQLKKTGYFRYYENQLKAGVHPARMNNIRNKADIIKRLEYLLTLKNKLMFNPNFDNFDMIEVYIDQIGRVRVFEGCHRLICCLYHGYGRIPVKVIYRHEQWKAFKASVLAEYKGGEMLYNPIEHPDFWQYPVIREDRINAILDFFEVTDFFPVKDDPTEHPEYTYKWNCLHYFQKDHAERVKGLEIGCHFGYFSRIFEQHGAEMTGIEHCPEYLATAQFLNRVFKRTVKYIDTDVFKYEFKEKFHFVMGLSIFYHLFTIDREKTIKLLQDIKANSQYFIIDSFPGKIEDAELISILESVGFKNIQKIFDGVDGRNIYVCEA